MNTAGQNRERAMRIALWDHPDDPRHGTANGYSNLYCRCEACTAAWAVYHTAYMNRDPERLRRHRIREANARHRRRRRAS